MRLAAVNLHVSNYAVIWMTRRGNLQHGDPGSKQNRAGEGSEQSDVISLPPNRRVTSQRQTSSVVGRSLSRRIEELYISCRVLMSQWGIDLAVTVI